MSHDATFATELTLLNELTEYLGVEFDPSLAREALGHAWSEVDGAPAADPLGPLAVAGRELGLRMTRVERSAKAVVELVHPSTPVLALAAHQPRQDPGSNGDGGHPAEAFPSDAYKPPGAVLLLGRQGRKVLVRIPGHGGSRWVTATGLAKLLGLESPGVSASWAVIQPMVPCDLASGRPVVGGHGSGHGHREGSDGGHGEQPPLRRLMSFLKPEAADIRVVLMFALGVGILSLATPLAVEALVTTIAFNRLYQQLLVLSLFLLACLGLAAGFRAMQTYVVEIIQQRLFVRLVSDLAYRLPRVRFDARDGSFKPELMNRFLDIVTVQKVVAQLLLDGVALVLATLVSLIVLAFYHPYLLGFDLIFLLLMAVFVLVLGRGAVRTSIDESRAKYAIAGWLEEIPRLPVCFASEPGRELVVERADALARTYLRARKGHFRILFRQILFAVLLQALASSVLLGLGGWLVMAGQLSLGQLVASELMVTTIAASFAKLGKHLEGYYDVLASMDKIGLLLDLPQEARGTESDRERGQAPSIGLVDVGYRFPGSHSTVFQGLSLMLHPGERLAVTGPTGSGKSTLAELLPGLRKPTEGRIEWNGVNLADYRLDELRTRIGLVRGAEILAGTVLENVRAGRPGILLAEARQSLEDVGLLEEILELPDGLHTMLDEVGGPLSEGQQLLLTLARAIAGKPRLLILDGVVDAVHPGRRPGLVDSLTDEDAPWSLVVVTHLPELIERCDLELKLGEGGPKIQQNQLARWPAGR